MLMTRISDQGAMTIAELSAAFNFDQSTLSRQTAPLCRAGLLERTEAPDAGAARRLGLTEQRREALEQDQTTNAEGLTRVVADWPSEEVEVFVSLLARFNQGIEGFGTRQPWPRPNPSTTRGTETIGAQ
ncbi:MarR family winged helix-turn-helix transcriptional regulator [Rhodococcus koreensis]